MLGGLSASQEISLLLGPFPQRKSITGSSIDSQTTFKNHQEKVTF